MAASALYTGTALAAVTDSLRKFWVKCYGPDGNGGSVAALKATTMELLEKMQARAVEGRVPSKMTSFEGSPAAGCSPRQGAAPAYIQLPASGHLAASG